MKETVYITYRYLDTDITSGYRLHHIYRLYTYTDYSDYITYTDYSDCMTSGYIHM